MEECNVSLTTLAMHYITHDSGNDFSKKTDLKKMLTFCYHYLMHAV